MLALSLAPAFVGVQAGAFVCETKTSPYQCYSSRLWWPQHGITLSECPRGYIDLQIYPRSQGESTKFWKIDGLDTLIWHILNSESYYDQGAYVDVIKGIDCLLSTPDVDKSKVGLVGTSQGGGIVFAVAESDPQVKVVAAPVPFWCNMRLAATIRDSLVRKWPQGHGVLNSNSPDTPDHFDPYVFGRAH